MFLNRAVSILSFISSCLIMSVALMLGHVGDLLAISSHAITIRSSSCIRRHDYSRTGGHIAPFHPTSTHLKFAIFLVLEHILQRLYLDDASKSRQSDRWIVSCGSSRRNFTPDMAHCDPFNVFYTTTNICPRPRMCCFDRLFRSHAITPQEAQKTCAIWFSQWSLYFPPVYW